MVDKRQRQDHVRGTTLTERISANAMTVLERRYLQKDADGKPVDWNETRWVDPEFNELLHKAEQTLDVEKRREIMSKLEDIQIERGSVGVPFWRNSWHAVSKKFKNVQFDPNPVDDFTEVWYDPAA